MASRANAKIGNVYFAEAPTASGLVKIGFTAGSAKERVRRLRYDSLYSDLSHVAAVIENVPFWLEHDLHHRFHLLRVKNELFRREGELDALISYSRDTARAAHVAEWFTRDLRAESRGAPTVNVAGAVKEPRRSVWYIPPGDALVRFEPTVGQMCFAPWGSTPRREIAPGSAEDVLIPAFVTEAIFEFSYVIQKKREPWLPDPVRQELKHFRIFVRRPFADRDGVDAGVSDSAGEEFSSARGILELLDKMPKRWSEPTPEE